MRAKPLFAGIEQVIDQVLLDPVIPCQQVIDEARTDRGSSLMIFTIFFRLITITVPGTNATADVE